jgi:hypothetical protein
VGGLALFGGSQALVFEDPNTTRVYLVTWVRRGQSPPQGVIPGEEFEVMYYGTT